MNTTINQVKSWGVQQSQHAITSAVMFIPVFLIIGMITIGITIVVLQLSDLMPDSKTFALKTLLGATILFSAIIATTLISANIWAHWLGYQGLGFIGLDNDARKFFAGILWGTALQVIIFSVLVASAWPQIDNIRFDSLAIINVLIVTVSSLNAGISEEVIFRGVLYSAFRSRWGWWGAALTTSALGIFFSSFSILMNFQSALH